MDQFFYKVRLLEKGKRVMLVGMFSPYFGIAEGEEFQVLLDRGRVVGGRFIEYFTLSVHFFLGFKLSHI